MKNRYPLDQSQLYRVTTRRKLADILGLTESGLQAAWRLERPFTSRQIEVVRNGATKMRHVQEPRGPLRPMHNRIRTLLMRIEPPDFLFCPVKCRSYVTNAALHAGAREIRTLDVARYFPSTPRHRVYWFFHTVMQCSADVASILAKLLTVDGHLATGSTVSPILSFYAFYDMWHAIAKIAREAGCKVSVYMDDLTVSGYSVPECVMWDIRQQVHSRQLVYHKERHFRRGIGEVTGVVVRDGSVCLPNRQRKKLYDLKTILLETGDATAASALTRSITGLTSQQKQVEG
jgi:hypothetical protein